ncbi:MAG: efflux RND transporter permease subunit [Deltaproteobacteria bacterium]|nr:efflux RND transporter permease subunit [Deltaproteobacteria bacterium]
MIPTLIRMALRQRWQVLGVTVFIVGLGVWAFLHQKIDAYPDISAEMVQVITTYPGRAPEEVERQVTIPIEIAMRNVPRVEVIRSRTIFGLSGVQMIFAEGTESYWARQRVQEKLSSIPLPEGVTPDLGPLATAYGEVLRYELVSDGTHDLMELRTLNDWVVIPRLLRAPGVADVSNFGGYAKQYTITLNPTQLQRFNLSLNEVIDAIKTNNASAGGSVVSRGSMSFAIRSQGSLQDTTEIGAIFLKSLGGTPIYMRDVAAVGLDSMMPSGIFSKDYTDESVEGMVLLRKGENPSAVLENVKAAIVELNTAELPEGVSIQPFYDRSFLVQSTLHTVAHSVLLGITLVVTILLLFLGRPAMAALVTLTIPFAFIGGAIALLVRGMNLNVSTAVGFAAVFGVSIMNGVLIVRTITTLRSQGVILEEAITQGAVRCLWPILMASLVAILGLLPASLATGLGSDVQRPLATVIVWGLFSSTVLTLFVVPVFYRIFVPALPASATEKENELATVSGSVQPEARA